MKSKLNPPGTKRLKLNCDVLLSASAFKFNLRRYTLEPPMHQACGPSRPTSPVAAPTLPSVTATTSASTSTEVSIPMDAPEPLWHSASKYPVVGIDT